MQESIANIRHHTRASEIRVANTRVGEGVTVSIDDNGQGFDVRQALGTATGRGLHHQQRCTHAIGGTVDWRSGPTGTHFMLWLPLARWVIPPAVPTRWPPRERDGKRAGRGCYNLRFDRGR